MSLALAARITVGLTAFDMLLLIGGGVIALLLVVGRLSGLRSWLGHWWAFLSRDNSSLRL